MPGRSSKRLYPYLTGPVAVKAEIACLTRTPRSTIYLDFGNPNCALELCGTLSYPVECEQWVNQASSSARPRSRAMIHRMISLVPSPISSTFESR
jgi:hypothetical protein